MTKIYLPDGSQISKEEFREVGKSLDGELVLLLRDQQIRENKSPKAMNLGVLKRAEIDKITLKLVFSCYYSLRPSAWLGGINIPIIEIPDSRNLYPHSEHTLYWTPNFDSVRFGKFQIVGELEKTFGYQAHANWIATLRKPYSV